MPSLSKSFAFIINTSTCWLQITSIALLTHPPRVLSSQALFHKDTSIRRLCRALCRYHHHHPRRHPLRMKNEHYRVSVYSTMLFDFEGTSGVILITQNKWQNIPMLVYSTLSPEFVLVTVTMTKNSELNFQTEQMCEYI